MFKTKPIAEIKYKEFEYEGKKPFENIEELMIKKLKKTGMFRKELVGKYAEKCIIGETIPGDHYRKQ